MDTVYCLEYDDLVRAYKASVVGDAAMVEAAEKARAHEAPPYAMFVTNSRTPTTTNQK